MANDVVSRIVIQAQGGDQAAREIGKTTKAFKEAGQASQGVGGTVNGGTTFDAFQKATFGGQGGGVGQAQGLNQNFTNQTNQRVGDHFRRFGGEGGAGGGIAGVRGKMSGVTGGANSVISGNAVGGGGQIMQSLAGAGTVGLIVAAVAGAAIGTKALADKDFERQKQVGHGLMQSLGMGTNWESMNNQLTAARRSGVSAENIMAYMGASAAAGGTTSVEAMEMANRATLVSGASANTIATLQASREKAGLGSSEAQLDRDIMRAGTFGPAGVNKFLGAVSTSIEGAMSRGMAKGSLNGNDLAYNAGTRMLSALALQGGMSQEGAMQTFSQLNTSVAGFQSMGSPQAAFQFMAQRKAGETYGQTVRRISTFGGQMEAYKNIKSQAGGDKGLLEIMVQQAFGLDWQAVPGTIEALENQIMDPSMRGQYAGGVFTPDNVLIESVQSRQMDILKDAGEGANKAWNWATRGWRNRNTRKAEEAEYNNLLGGGYGAGTSIGAMKATGDVGALPPEISQFADLAKANAMDTFLGQDNAIMSDLLPQLAGYEQFRTNRGSMTAEEQAMYETFAPLFDSLIATLADPTIARGASAGTWMDDYDRRVTSLDASKDVDNLLGTISVVELLEAINEKLGLASIMDSDSTESGQ